MLPANNAAIKKDFIAHLLCVGGSPPVEKLHKEVERRAADRVVAEIPRMDDSTITGA
jgi:hypothetical protein